MKVRNSEKILLKRTTDNYSELTTYSVIIILHSYSEPEFTLFTSIDQSNNKNKQEDLKRIQLNNCIMTLTMYKKVVK